MQTLNEDRKAQLADRIKRETGDEDRITLSLARRIAEDAGLPLLTVERVALESGVVPWRYESNLGTLGVEGQLTLLRSRAAVVGLGGLGGNVLESLARLGCGHITGIDPDRFEEKNLNRQVLAGTGHIGEVKTAVAAERAEEVNPAVEFTGYSERVEEAAPGALSDCSVVLDCLDSIDARRALARACSEADVPLIHGAVAGWSGQVALCEGGGDVLDKLYAGDTQGMERRLGNMAVTPAVAANLMVARALRLVLNLQRPPAGEVLFFDLLNDEWRTVQL